MEYLERETFGGAENTDTEQWRVICVGLDWSCHVLDPYYMSGHLAL